MGVDMDVFYLFVKKDWRTTFKLAVLLGWLGVLAIGWGTFKWPVETVLRFLWLAPAFMLAGLIVRFAAFYSLYRHTRDFEDTYFAFTSKIDK